MGEHATGASSSLNKTITDLMEYLGDRSRRPSPFDADLRNFLQKKIHELAASAFTKGFKQGHRDCAAKFSKSGEVPNVLPFKGRPDISYGLNRSFEFESKIRW